jgi:CubicO group peptidase (beta-lactamase class C family)
MKRSLAIILSSLFTVVTAMAQGAQQKSATESQSLNASQSTPTVDQIIDRYVQAIGGEAALRKVTSRIINLTLVIEGDDVTASFESYSQAPNKGDPYGLGLFEYDSKSPGKFYGHAGGVPGFAAKLGFVPAQKLGFAILTNGSGAGGKMLSATTLIVLGHLLVQP